MLNQSSSYCTAPQELSLRKGGGCHMIVFTAETCVDLLAAIDLQGLMQLLTINVQWSVLISTELTKTFLNDKDLFSLEVVLQIFFIPTLVSIMNLNPRSSEFLAIDLRVGICSDLNAL
ncbi:hypothetical protein Tco_0771342 [Tanacetum coccineum]|uniref:Uncharacterized protein n=1 Tax=Tanacetum coccineum TaxID=301880 RepID=A0ABQ4ZGP5_9ASTR